MIRKHSFLTRCLAMLLAVVLVVSLANVGLALHALAADNGESLYALISKSTCGTPELRAILAAGGLSGDQSISYAEPTADDAEDLLTLKNGRLTAESYASGLNGAAWKPYSYGTEGTENLFNGEAEWTADNVNVVYSLNLGAIAADSLALAAKLANEAAAQNAVLQDINNYQDNLSKLRKSTMNGLRDEVEYADTSDEIKAEFIEIIANLKACINEDTGNVQFYHSMEGYNQTGLVYFYQNYEKMISEIKDLSVNLNNLVGSQEKIDALESICENLGYDGYAEKFVTLAGVMENAAENLAAPNAAIDVNNTALVKAIDAAGAVSNYTVGDLVLSTNLYVLDSTYVHVVVTVKGPTGTKTVPVKFENGAVVSAEAVCAQVEATAASMLGDKAAYYTLDAAELDALDGTTITKNIPVTCTWNANEYTVKIHGVDDQTVSINDLTIMLPAHTQAGHSYTYFINGNPVNAGLYTLTAADLDALFTDGVLTIERLDNNIYRGDLEKLVAQMNAKVGNDKAFVLTKGEEGDYVGLTANIKINQLVDFCKVLIDSDYVYVGLNNKTFYDGEYVSVQALIDAILNDSGFNSQRLIDLGQNGQGKFLHTTMQVRGYDLDFVLNLTAVPAEMKTVSKALSAVQGYMSFQSNNGILDVSATLPEKVYEAYMTAVMGIGYADDDNLEAMKNMIAAEYVADYFELLMNSDVNTTTFSNTLANVGIDRDLSGFESYYQNLKDLATGENFKYKINDSSVDVTVAGNSKNINRVLNLLGLSSALLKDGKFMIKEEPLSATVSVNLTNDASEFEAFIVNPNKVHDAGYMNKVNAIDYTKDLIGSLASAKGSCAVVLLDDINGSLNFPSSAVLDLNGNTVNGNVTANGTLIIVDSALDTYHGGKVTGSVSANRGAITGGTYGSDVTSFLKDGYIQDNGSVRNAIYYIENNNGTYEFVLNADFYQLCDGYLPSVKALAVDVTADVVMNMYPAVGLSYGSNTIYSLNIDNILDSYLGGGADGAIDALLGDVAGSIHASGINALANDIIDDLCDFKALSAALNAGETLVSYDFTVNPITVDFNHVAEGDFLDFSLVANTNAGKSFGVALKIDGSNKYYNYAKDLLAAMSEILSVDAQVELKQPTYDAAGNTMSVGGSAYADVVLDLSGNANYTKGIAIILAYGNEEWADELMNAKDCAADLSEIISQMSVEDVFTALKVMSRDVSMTEMADAVGYKYTVDEIADLEDVYHVVLCGLGKALEKLDITGNNNALSTYQNADGDYTYSKNVSRSGDASVKGYTGVYDVTSVKVSVTIKLASDCNESPKTDEETEIPETGDLTPVIGLSFAAMISLAGASALIFKRKFVK